MNTPASKLFVDNLHKQYGDNEVLKGVSLRAKAGDVISIIGSSGSGKSTMLRCINFLGQRIPGPDFCRWRGNPHAQGQVRRAESG